MTIADSDGFSRAERTPARYPINLRITIPFYPRAMFMTVIVGSEKRGRGRLRDERARHPVNTWGNVLAVTMALSIASVAALFVALLLSA